jgi:hypothetical protein
VGRDNTVESLRRGGRNQKDRGLVMLDSRRDDIGVELLWRVEEGKEVGGSRRLETDGGEKGEGCVVLLNEDPRDASLSRRFSR